MERDAVIVAGFGFRKAATADSLLSAYDRAAAECPADMLAAPADKCTAPCLQDLARHLNLPLCPVDAADLVRQVPATESRASRANRGTGSVCEAAALAAAGPGSSLITTRKISQDRLATCSLATGKQE